MKYFSILLILMLGFSKKTVFDAGDCIKYSVSVQLIDGHKSEGFIFVGGYERKFQFKDTTFFDYLKRVQPVDTFILYKNIRQLKFPKTNLRDDCEFHFEAADSSNYIKILKNKIRDIRMISYGICNQCDVAHKQNGYYWNGIYPVVITELTKSEIDLLQTTPKGVISFGHNIKENNEVYWMLSYSEDHKEADLERIKYAFLSETDKLLNENKWYVAQAKYKALKNELRKKDIVLFKTGFAI